MFRFNQRRGMLAETMVAATVLAVVMTLVFGIIIASERMFNQSTLRQGLQSDLSRLAMELKRDADLTDYWRASQASRSYTIPVTGPTVDRDGLCVVALTDWNNPDNFDPVTNLPLWDQYIVYCATRSNPGLLYRQEIRPGASVPVPLGPYAALATNLSDNPNSNANVYRTTLISTAVQSMKVALTMTNGSLSVKIHLRREGMKRANSEARVVESLESTMTIRPRNTWPRV